MIHMTSLRKSFPAAALSVFVWVFCAQGAQAKEAIVGGHTINIKDAPWQMLMQAHGRVSNSTCGASWLGGRWVLTAAHCVERFLQEDLLDSIFLYAGITRREETKASNALKLRSAILHPYYPWEWMDIAILELSSDVTAVDARPIRMATPEDVALGLTNLGVQVMATGWGGLNRAVHPSDTLRMVKSKVDSLAPYTIWWGGQGGTEQIGSCQGDSGGPMVVKDATGTQWILAGISSKIYSYCGDPNAAVQYTRVSAFFDWVMQATKNTVGIQPKQTAASGNLRIPANGRFFLERGQALDLIYTAPNGALIRNSRAYYSQGEHAVPKLPETAGPYFLRLRGNDIDVTSRN